MKSMHIKYRNILKLFQTSIETVDNIYKMQSNQRFTFVNHTKTTILNLNKINGYRNPYTFLILKKVSLP